MSDVFCAKIGQNCRRLAITGLDIGLFERNGQANQASFVAPVHIIELAQLSQEVLVRQTGGAVATMNGFGEEAAPTASSVPVLADIVNALPVELMQHTGRMLEHDAHAYRLLVRRSFATPTATRGSAATTPPTASMAAPSVARAAPCWVASPRRSTPPATSHALLMARETTPSRTSIMPDGSSAGPPST
jgi:hypothetical protein